MTAQSGVAYRPGRIQSLSGNQEIVLKQTWAHYLKYLGYPLDFPDEDLIYKECYVASTSTAESEDPGFTQLTRTATRNSINSAVSHKTSGTSMSKKRGLFGKKAAPVVAPAAPPPNSKRMNTIQSGSSFNKYVPVEVPSDEFYQVYGDFYKQTYEYDDDYESEDSEDDDDLSLETFVTASTSLTEPEPEETYAPSPPQRTKSRIVHPNQRKSSYSAPKQPAPPKVTREVHPTPLAPVRAPSTRRVRSTGHVKPNPKISAILGQYDPKLQHAGIFAFPSLDLTDNWMLRFVRARKFELEPALTMLSKSMQWRRDDMSAAEWVLEGDAESYLTGTNKGFIKNFTSEKSWIEGTDDQNNPIFWFQAKKHFGSDSPAEETQRYAVVTIEWVRLFLREVNESVDTCSIVFDLTGFSLKNADYTSIKFLADVFEAHYPESLGRIYIHNAPWIFSTVWNIVKNWLDPVVASKIHFTKNYKELCVFIHPKFIPTNLGGENQTGSDYPSPKPHHASPPKQRDSKYRSLRKDFDDLRVRFIETTSKWIEATSPAVSERYLQDKIALSVQMSYIYIELDPYLRCPGIYDRNHSLVVRN